MTGWPPCPGDVVIIQRVRPPGEAGHPWDGNPATYVGRAVQHRALHHRRPWEVRLPGQPVDCECLVALIRPATPEEAAAYWLAHGAGGATP